MAYNWDGWGDDIVLPLYQLTPDNIIKGRIGLFNINFFDPTAIYGKNYDKNDPRTYEPDHKNSSGQSDYTGRMLGNTNIASDLKATISKWYVTLRNIAIILMLSILLYIGIRILMSSTADNKAKYKQLILDWIIGMCMIFVMHYGMAAANIVVDKMVAGLGDSIKISWNAELEYDKDNLEDRLKKAVQDANDDKGLDLVIYDTTEKGKAPGENDRYDFLIVKDKDGKKYLHVPTDLMGEARLQAQYYRNGSVKYLGYGLLFLIMVFYTVFFTITYLKRVLYMAFLTLIAPFVALMYPLDKVKDGQAQTFNFWCREYLYNLLLQPLHLILYYVLVGSAAQLATSNLLYSVVAMGFLIPSEKLIRQMFGFKGSTPGFISGAVGAGMAMNAMKYVLGHGPKEENNKIDTPKGSDKIKTKDIDYSSILGSSGSNGEGTQNRRRNTRPFVRRNTNLGTYLGSGNSSSNKGTKNVPVRRIKGTKVSAANRSRIRPNSTRTNGNSTVPIGSSGSKKTIRRPKGLIPAVVTGVSGVVGRKAAKRKTTISKAYNNAKTALGNTKTVQKAAELGSKGKRVIRAPFKKFDQGLTNGAWGKQYQGVKQRNQGIKQRS